MMTEEFSDGECEVQGDFHCVMSNNREEQEL